MSFWIVPSLLPLGSVALNIITFNLEHRLTLRALIARRLDF